MKPAGKIQATEKKLLEAVFAAPDEDAPRLVYADWLTSQNNPHGEFIIIQIELAKLGVPNVEALVFSDHDDARIERAARLLRRERALVTDDWTWPTYHLFRTASHSYARGFPGDLDFSSAQFGDDGRKSNDALLGLLSLASVRSLTGDVQLLADARSGKLARLRSLHLSSQVSAETMTELFDHMENLAELTFTWPSGVITADHLRNAPPSLVRLGLRSCGITAATLEAMKALRCMKSIRAIDISANNLSDAATSLIDAAICPALEEIQLQELSLTPAAFSRFDKQRTKVPLRFRSLDVGRNPLLDSAIGAIVESPLTSSLETLELNQIMLGDAAMEALALSVGLKKLTRLTINVGNCSPGGAELVAEITAPLRDLSISDLPDLPTTFFESLMSDRRHALRSLGLHNGSELGSGGPYLAQLASLPQASTLRSLSVSRWDCVGGRDFEVLASSSPHLENLRRLELVSSRLHSKDAKVIAEGDGLPSRLIALNLSGNDLGKVGAEALAKNVERFPRLVDLRLGDGYAESYEPILKAYGTILRDAPPKP